jgi:hypothetical protein
MAEKDNSTGTRRFDKSLNEDVNDYHLPENSWTHARNAINNSRTGDLGKLGNEPSNLLCAEIKSIRSYLNFPINTPLTIIGTVHLYADYWAIFSTNDFISQIGIFQEDRCLYTGVIEDITCLNFKLTNLIKGVSRSKSTCVYGVYWDDGLNLSRTVDLDIDNIDNNFPFIPNTIPAQTNINSPIPWVQNCVNTNNCITCENTNQVDCNKLRLARLITTPCVEVKKGVSGGTLMNGSYMVAIAYAINGIKASDWYISNVQSLFDHNNIAGSIDVDLNLLDQTFEEIQVALVYIVNEQSLARLAGVYSVRQKRLSFDTIDNTWPSVPVNQLPLITPVIEKTDAMFNVLDYLVRSGTTSKEDFNYQPLANQIVTKWQSVEYPENYYRKGGNKTNYMRDEVYPFFIRWVFDTGDKSSAYHIPGRGIIDGINTEAALTSTDALEDEVTAGINYKWAVQNTAVFTGVPANPNLPDGGVIVGEGLMGYWESTEIYPDKKDQVWNSVTNPLSLPGVGFNTSINPYATYNTNIDLITLDLCGTPIRHHRFPDMSTHASCQYYNSINNKIRIMAVKFDNIKHPLMNDGVTPVPGIVGYEIMRGVRNGNKTVLAKGIICNMRTYSIPNSPLGGAFVNYPYNDLGPDPFLSTSIITPALCSPFTQAASGAGNFNAQSSYSRSLFSFHSPDTNFKEPYLSGQELKIHGEYTGDVRGKFEKSEKHPKEKLMSNFSFVLSSIIGFGQAMLALRGERQVNYLQPNSSELSGLGTGVASQLSPGPTDDIALGVVNAAQAAWAVGAEALYGPFNPLTLTNLLLGTGDSALLPLPGTYGFQDAIGLATNVGTIANTGIAKYTKDIQQKDGPQKAGGAMSIVGNIPMFFNYWKESTDSTLELIKSLLTYRDFALRYHSHCYYSNYILPTPGNIRKSIGNSQYVGPQITSINANTRVNNLYRAKTVVVDLFNSAGQQLVTNPTTTEATRILASNVNSLYEIDTTNPTNPISLVDPTRFEFGTGQQGPSALGFPYSNLNRPTPNGVQTASSHYASLKQRIRNQYGQLTGVITVPASYCSYPSPPQNPLGAVTSSETVFGGDTYLGRYTEKNSFFYFYNWLYGELDGAQIDYTRNEMIPYPRFWANFNGFETGDFISSLAPSVSTGFTNLVLPNKFYNLDGDKCFNPFTGGLANLRYAIKNAWFYLFNSGVKDFYVESDYNVDLRDWGETIEQEHYDPYRFTDTKSLFSTEIIKVGNYYKYDDSLSISKLFINYVSWAVTQRYNYDPYLAETCYVYKDSRVIYSLPMQYESLHDNWRDFLANNYYDFDTPVTAVKSINKSGALFFFDSQSPLMFQGLDQLQTTLGTSLTIGDGQLFSQPQQALVNADRPYEYASCQNRMSVINTPIGPYWMSQNQGKIFSFSGGLEEISMQDLKWWLINYLPYKLTESYPNFELTDNPVIGIGCQSMFDNQNGLIYFTKKDFIVKTDLPVNTTLVYLSSNLFNVVVDNIVRFTVKLGDDRFFEDASWTISYDPKTKSWISYHDWHPSLMMPGKNTFMTVKDNKIWIHNSVTATTYCNFYGKNYPFEVEYMVDTVQTVNTVRSIEYQLECFKYATNNYDRFHVLDFNFDQAVVYNTEQVSGMLNLNLAPKNNPMDMIKYPIIHVNMIDILYSKVENKYRFNQFWDITDNRGEYNPNAQRMIWNTGANGYDRTLNPNNLNYNKPSFQRKKFRHYTNTVFLRKKVCGDRKMLVILTNNKQLYSPR